MQVLILFFLYLTLRHCLIYYHVAVIVKGNVKKVVDLKLCCVAFVSYSTESGSEMLLKMLLKMLIDFVLKLVLR
jgi:hypothetical protein